MPELPEVQTTVNGINAKVKGLKIISVWTDYRSVSHIGKDNIKDVLFFKNFEKKITSKKILGANRRAKNILIHLSGDLTILIHMKMTGHLMYGRYHFDPKKKTDPWSALEKGPLQDPFNRFIHLVITLSSKKQLVLSDVRKFAKVTLLETKDLEHSPHLKDIGPEIVGQKPTTKLFTADDFKKRLQLRPNGRIKTVLMDQTIIAGVGNIYSDEALWRAGIHPEEQIENLSLKNFQILFKAVKDVLAKGIDFGGDSTSDYRNIDGERGKFQAKHRAYRQTGKPCTKPGCKGIIVRKIIATRSAHFCNKHQKLNS